MRVIKFLLVVCFIMSSFSYGADKLVFGINPYRSPDVLREMYRDYLEYLEKELNKEIVFVVSKDYAHLAELIENGTVDFASVSPKLLATMREKDKRAQYLATIQIKDIHHQITGTYNGLILARKDSGIRTLQDLKGKRFAFTDKDSTSGYFYPRILLKEAHVDVDKDFSIVYMLKKHPKVIQALLERSIDAGAVSGAAYEEALVGENKEKIHQNLQI